MYTMEYLQTAALTLSALYVVIIAAVRVWATLSTFIQHR